MYQNGRGGRFTHRSGKDGHLRRELPGTQP
ncbi:hypothetical protein K353_01631 [Kitasatospora sp. SolWspMP-SS2h]|nr:hypothetical protein K353_01631 [Kitasatospora sp. SolWspMP-SS2h]